MGNFIMNAILFGIIYTDKGKELANQAVNYVYQQAKGLLGSTDEKENNDGRV